MFDSLSGPSVRTSVLAATPVAALASALSRALSAPSGLDDPARVDTIRALEELGCVVTAAQAMLSAELDQSQRASQASQGMPSAPEGRGVAAQVALARRQSPHRGARHLGLATIVSAELPHTWAAWRAGRITEWKATLIARETACLSREDRVAVDRAVAGDPDRVEQMGDRELVTACQKEAYTLDPEAYLTRRRRAETDRTVTLRPAPDAMTWLSALLPVKDGVAAFAALAREADTARAVGDERSRGQVMADTLTDSIIARANGRRDAQTTWNPAPVTEAQRPGVGVSIGLVLTDRALFGTSDEPGHLEGFGPVPAELGRELVADACSRGEKVWLRRLYASLATGELVAMDSRERLFRGSLARFIRLRDQFCRTPWCDAPIRHLDHADDVAHGGATRAENAQGLCEACNYAKQAAGWAARAGPDEFGHRTVTTTPTGHRHQSRAPVLVRMGRAPCVVDIVLAG